MTRVCWRPAVWGALFAVVSYYVFTIGIVIPLTGMFSTLDPDVVQVVIVAALVGLQVSAGALVVSLVRGRVGLERRRDALATVLAAGACGWVVMTVFTVLAYLGVGDPVQYATLAWTFPLWVGAPVVGLLLVAPGAPVVRANRFVARLDRERGAVTAEYSGAIVIAVLLVAALLLAFGSGGAVSERLKYVICQAISFGQGDCQAPGATTAQVDPHKPTEACVRSTSADTNAVEVGVGVFAAKGGGTVRVEEMSDGTFRVSAEGVQGVGVTVGEGGSATVTINDKTYGVAGEVSATALATGTGGLTWVVDGSTNATRLKDFLTEKRDLSTLGPVGTVAGVAEEGARAGWEFLTGNKRYQPPAPTEIYREVAVSGTVSGSASDMALPGTGSSGVQGAPSLTGSASVEAAVAIGTRLNFKTGALTTYYTYRVAGEADLGVDAGSVTAGASASGSVEVLLAVTLDPEGNPVEVTATGQAAGDVKAQVEGLFRGEPVGLTVNGGRLYSASVELTRPETASIATDLLQATGIVPADKNVVQQAGHASDALDTFLQAARERGVVTRQDLATDKVTPFAIQASGDVDGLGLSAGFENSTTRSDYTKAQYLSNGLWKDWNEC